MALSQAFNDRLKVIASANPDLILQNAIPLKDTKTAFRITATHAPSAFDLTKKHYVDMASAMMGNKFILVADSISIISTNGLHVVSGIIEANNEVREFKDDEVREKMTSLATNLFVDDEDHIWKVVESGGTKHLVQQIKEDYTALVAARIARRGNQVVSANYSGMVPANGDYIAYYNTQAQAINWGYAVVSNGLHVIDRATKQSVAISTANIIEAIDGDSMDKTYSLSRYIKENQEVLADNFSNGGLLQSYLKYAATLYAGTDYFRKLEELVAKRKAFGRQDFPVSTYHA